jgi:hypothetical protein
MLELPAATSILISLSNNLLRTLIMPIMHRRSSVSISINQCVMASHYADFSAQKISSSLHFPKALSLVIHGQISGCHGFQYFYRLLVATVHDLAALARTH